MKYIVILALLTGCATAQGGQGAIQAKGGGLYAASELHTGDPAAAAVRFCAPRRMAIQATTTQHGAVSGRSYSVLLFRCVK